VLKLNNSVFLKLLRVFTIFILVWQVFPAIVGDLLRYFDFQCNAIVANELTILVGSLIIFFFVGIKKKQYGFHFNPEGFIKVILLTLLIQSLTILSFTLLVAFDGSIPDFFTRTPIQWILLVYVLLPALCEEIFMRGLIQTECDFLRGSLNIRSISLSSPVLVSAFLFGAMHLFPLGSKEYLNFLFTFLLGLIAGYYKEKSGSLFPAIIAHASYNFLGFLPAKLIYLAFGN
jgi:membrane protease YdiL (CAAX protease family)